MKKELLISIVMSAITVWYTTPSDRLPALKTFAIRCCFAAIIFSHGYSSYLIAINPGEMTVIRELTLVVAGLGFIVLAAAGWFLEAHRRGYFDHS